MVRPLTIPDVSRIHFQGGSILRTSRAVVTKEPGERGAGSGHPSRPGALLPPDHRRRRHGLRLHPGRAGNGRRCPNRPGAQDHRQRPPLPGDMPTFGFETARHMGTELVLNLMEDARTTNRWFFVVVMGRVAGTLALGIGKACRRHHDRHPGEFDRGAIGLRDLCLLLEGSVIKRLASGQRYGVAVIAEGVGDRLDPQELAGIPGVAVELRSPWPASPWRDSTGDCLAPEVQRRLAERGAQVTISEAASLGYASAAPAPPLRHRLHQDVGTRRSAPAHIPGPGGEAALWRAVCLQAGNLQPVPYGELLDPKTDALACGWSTCRPRPTGCGETT